MADESVIINASTIPGGAAIAVDTISGISHELVKLEYGDDGVAIQVSETNPLPVKISSDIQIGSVELKNATDDTRAIVTPANALKVDNSGVTQPVSGSVSISNFPATQPVSGSVAVSNFPATQPISAAALPLPTGAATEVTLSTLNTNTAKEFGTWGYVSGSLTGAGNKTGVGRCVGIRVFANGVDSNFNINGGDTIPVRNGAGVDIIPKGNLSNAVVNWVSGSIDVLIESVT